MPIQKIHSNSVFFSAILLAIACYAGIFWLWSNYFTNTDDKPITLTLEAEFADINSAPELIKEEISTAIQSNPSPNSQQNNAKNPDSYEIEESNPPPTINNANSINTEVVDPKPREEKISKPEEIKKPEETTPKEPEHKITSKPENTEPKKNTSQTKPAVNAKPSEAGSTQTVAQATVIGDERYKDYYQALVAHLRRYKNYPDEARQAKTEGTVKLHVVIHYTGTAISVDVVQSSGSDILDDAAKKAALNASPFLPIPEQYHLDLYDFIVNLEYKIER